MLKGKNFDYVCCVMNHINRSGFKQGVYIISEFLWVENVGAAYLGASGSGSVLRLQ